ncbi:dsp1-1-like protein [Pochonia chlamydosporia 170]|uniref:Dsp1-1-like protein n=1 Tax=Pochonia chlamydosporia 170 TaxID=1380566 RepID=A0A179G974_METCM|nr:dsp1-1-like protein [Pochonia chlamydosporia 170]OAQ73933.1 dsp1-1-like protein [Pochonia chlamydosporia 170]
MPYRLDTHVLTVDANVIHKVDTANPANLYSMWTVFSRCADSVEQGRRLENLSWRLWQREQLVENANKNDASCTTATTTDTLPKNVPSDARIQEVPQLSGSVESLADDEAVDFTSVSAPLEIRPRIRRLDSSTTRRDRRISSDDFEKMIVSIVKDKAPLSAPSQTSPLMASTKEPAPAPLPPTLTRSGSTTTESQSSEQISEDSHPSPMPTSEGIEVQALSFPEPAAAASSEDPLPEPRSSPAPMDVQPKKQPARFALGGSCSSSEHSQSIDNVKATSTAVGKKPMFQIGGSSGEDSLKSSVHSNVPITLNNMPSELMQQSENAVDSDTEAEYIDESAIDDDDSSDWEDSTEDSGKSSVDDKFFQRVESKANLASRPSLITLMLAQNERANTLGNQASQSTPAIHRSRAAPNGISLAGSPNDSDEAPLMMKGFRHAALNPISEIPRSTAQPIVTRSTHTNFPAAFSPRTTRRNMLATELTESLRLNLVWERQQKKFGGKALLKRRHTSQDVANLKQYPQKACMKPSEDVEAHSWNQYFSKEALNGYHSKGW